MCPLISSPSLLFLMSFLAATPCCVFFPLFILVTLSLSFLSLLLCPFIPSFYHPLYFLFGIFLGFLLHSLSFFIPPPSSPSPLPSPPCHVMSLLPPSFSLGFAPVHPWLLFICIFLQPFTFIYLHFLSLFALLSSSTRHPIFLPLTSPLLFSLPLSLTSFNSLPHLLHPSINPPLSKYLQMKDSKVI